MMAFYAPNHISILFELLSSEFSDMFVLDLKSDKTCVLIRMNHYITRVYKIQSLIHCVLLYHK